MAQLYSSVAANLDSEPTCISGCWNWSSQIELSHDSLHVFFFYTCVFPAVTSVCWLISLCLCLVRMNSSQQPVNNDFYLFLTFLDPLLSHLWKRSLSIITSPTDSFTALRRFSMHSFRRGSDGWRPVFLRACKQKWSLDMLSGLIHSVVIKITEATNSLL